MKPKPKEAESPARRASPAIWLAFALALVTFLAYARLPSHGFTWWDDHQTLHRNLDFNPPTLHGIARYWKEPAGGLYIPVTYTVWGLLSVIAYGERLDPSGAMLNAGVFHVASILVHIASALIVMALLRRLPANGNDRGDDDHTTWAAFAGAMLFALHPVQVESVAWASGMKDLLFGFFSLMSLWQYTDWAQRLGERNGGRGVPRPYVIALAAAGLGMLSKPTAVVVPIAAFVIDYWLLGRPLRKVMLALTPFVIFAAITAVIARMAQPASHVAGAPIWARPFIVGDSLAFYVYKLVLPVWLAVDYGRRPGALIGTAWPYVAWIVPAALAVAAWLVRRTARQLLVASLLFAIGALPVLGLLPFEFQGYSSVADHYLYLSMLGPALALAWCVRRFAAVRIAAACAVVFALLWLRTMLQTRHWRDDEALWTNNLEVNPRSFLAYTNLGFWHDLHRRHDRATEMYREAVKITDDYINARAMYSLANNLMRAAEYDEAAGWYQKFIDAALTVPAKARSGARLDQAYLQLGRAMAAAGRKEEAAGALKKALELNPGLTEASESLKKL